MKLICLNIWNGRRYQQLLDFISHNARSTDLFCFQEVHTPDGETVSQGVGNSDTVQDIYQRMQARLPRFESRLSKEFSSLHERLAIFSSSEIAVEGSGDLLLCKGKEQEIDGIAFSGGSRLQWISFNAAGKKFTIANVYGYWMHKNKMDSPERLMQSRKILNFCNSRKGSEIILCGDLNLTLQTKSISMLDGKLRNLISESGAKTTRSSFVSGKDAYADYVFVSPGVDVKEFKVLNNEVSDHLPLFLNFS